MRLVVGAMALLLSLHTAVYCVEAEKEARVLCALSRVGTHGSEIDRLFGTANLLTVRRERLDAEERLTVSSARNAHLSGCTLSLAQGRVTASTYHERFRLAEPAGLLALVLMSGLVLLHLLLAAGVPFGHLAWGGRHERLPAGLRVASAGSAIVLATGVLCTAHLTGRLRLPEPLGRAAALLGEPLLGLLTLVFLLGVFGNLASGSRLERRIATPVAFLLTVAGVVLLLGG